MLKTTAKPGYFPCIDGLRLVASAGIVLFHIVQIGGLNDMHATPGWFFAVIKGPPFHASLFFIIGGFIYGYKFGKTDKVFNGWDFFKRRLRALYPLHAAMTIIMIPICLTTMQGLGFFDIPLAAIIHLLGLSSFFPVTLCSLNTPSWALSAFFLCYALIGPALKVVARLKTRRSVLVASGIAMLPILAWSFTYVYISNQNYYSFFHIFAPLRFFEFFIGMLVARFFVLSHPKGFASIGRYDWILNDIAIAVLIICIYYNVKEFEVCVWQERFFRYHVFMTPLYAMLLYALARGTGIIAWVFKFPLVRALGICSFYPFLIHIPLISLICLFTERVLHYHMLLHSPLRVTILMVSLYVGSALVWRKVRG